MKNNMVKEEWRPVRGKEDYAEISNYGLIHRFEREYYSGRGHKIKKVQEETFTYGSKGSGGYLYVNIRGKSFRVNRLVYMTFVGDIPEGLEVNHIDEDKHNNCIWNLNLMTRKENCNWGTRNIKIGDALRGRKRPDIADALKGKPKSQEAKARMSAAHRGKKLSPEHIAKISAAKRGKPNPKLAAARRGMKRSEETKKKISASNRGKKRSEETKAKIAAAQSKPVQALDKATGKVIMEFPSAKEAQRQYGFNASHITACCRGKLKTHKGFIWRWKFV